MYIENSFTMVIHQVFGKFLPYVDLIRGNPGSKLNLPSNESRYICFVNTFVSDRNSAISAVLYGYFWKFFYINKIWVKAFKNGPSKICGRQPFHKFYLVHS